MEYDGSVSMWQHGFDYLQAMFHLDIGVTLQMPRITLPKTNIFAPENGPKPKRKVVSKPSIFRGELLVSGMVTANNQEQYKKQEELFMTLSKKSSGRLRNRYGSGIGRRRDGMLI